MQEKDKNKVPSTFEATIEARRKVGESVKAAMQPSRGIAEVMKQYHDSIEHLRKFANPTSQVAEMMRQIKQQQQVYADMRRPLNNIAIPEYLSGIRQMMKQLKVAKPSVEVFKQYRQAFDATNTFKSMAEEHREAQRKIAEALKPSFQFQKSIALELSRINSWQDTFRSITDSLKGFRPGVEVVRDAMVIEEERFSQEDINQIAEEYIWDENSDKNIFKQDGKYLSWEEIPKPVRWLITLIVATVFAIYFIPFWNEMTKDTALSPETVTKQLVHFRKQDVRQIKQSQQSENIPPFVNTECLLVHTAPKRKGQVIAVLSYPYEVTILKFKNKKRWALIEWENELNEVRQGWVLGRYVYRKDISNSE